MTADEHNFQAIKEYLLNDPECKTVHKIIWSDVAYITTPWMSRYRVTADMTLDKLKWIVDWINNFNSETAELEKVYRK